MQSRSWGIRRFSLEAKMESAVVQAERLPRSPDNSNSVWTSWRAAAIEVRKPILSCMEAASARSPQNPRRAVRRARPARWIDKSRAASPVRLARHCFEFVIALLQEATTWDRSRCPPARRPLIAWSSGTAFRYCRSEAIASRQSTAERMRAPMGIFLPPARPG